MLTFTETLGNMYDGSPEEVPELLADLVNADGEHTDVSFSNEHEIAVSVDPDLWITIEDVEGSSILPKSLRASGTDQVVEIARLLDQGQHDQILASYDWTEGYPVR